MATYYVDYDTGDDTNNGTTTSTPWKHCPGDGNDSGNANITLQPGDTVVFKGGVVYDGIMEIKGPGTSGNPVTFTSGHPMWGATPAIIDGTNYDDAVFEFSHAPGGRASYIEIRNLEIRNFWNYGVAIRGDYCKVDNCEIHYSRQTTGSTGEPLFIAEGDHNEFTNNECYDSNYNGINVQNANYTLIKGNVIHGVYRHGALNLISNTSSYYGMMYHNDVIGNYCYDVAGPAYIRYQGNAIWANNLFDGRDFPANNNVRLHYGDGGPTTWDGAGLCFYNNTILGGAYGFYNECGHNVTFKNNIIYLPDGARFISISSGLTGCVLDRNIYHGAKAWFWLGSTYATFANWQSGSGQDANGKNEDPLLTDPGSDDFTLQSGSGAINAGETLGDVTDDYDGLSRPQGAGYDIGAYEYDEGGSPSSPWMMVY